MVDAVLEDFRTATISDIAIALATTDQTRDGLQCMAMALPAG